MRFLAASPPFLQTAVPLSGFCTFGIGGPARALGRVTSQEELAAALAYCYTTQQPYCILGRGSNCLFDDAGFDGVILINRLTDCCELSPGLWRVGAGFSIARLAALTAKRGWSGMEFASGIPGSVGGAIYMNGGANGRETADSLVEVHFVDPSGTLQTFPRESLTFGYRSSPFQTMPGAIIGATFRLEAYSQAEERLKEIIAHRTAIHPYDMPSAGCIFRNPPGASAGALIEKAGLKGHTIGDAQVSHKHANFIVNRGKATSADVLSLIAVIRETVYERYHISLQNEVRYISPDGSIS